MAYKIKLKHNISGKTLSVNLKYDDPNYPDLPLISTSVKNNYGDEIDLSPWSSAGVLDKDKIKINEKELEEGKTSYYVQPLTFPTDSGSSQGSSDSSDSASTGNVVLDKSFINVTMDGLDEVTVNITNNVNHSLSVGDDIPIWINGLTLTKNTMKFKVYGNRESMSRKYDIEIIDDVTDDIYHCVIYQDGYNDEYLAPKDAIPENNLVHYIPTNMPKVRIYHGNAVKIKPDRKLKIYDNGTYALELKENEVGVVKGTFFTGVPNHASINFYMRHKTYELDQTEVVDGVSHRYAAIPLTDLDYYNNGANTLYINYKNGERQPTFVKIIVHGVVYDVQDGQMKLYENGYCNIGDKYKFQLFTTIEDKPFVYYTAIRGGMTQIEYPFSDDVKEEIMYNGEMVELRYVILPYERFSAPGLYDMAVDYNDGRGLSNYNANIFVYDSQFSLTFKENTLMIDRCQQGALDRQFDSEHGHHGIYLRDYIDIHIGDVIMDFGTEEDVYEYLKNLGAFGVNLPGGISGKGVYTESAIEITHGQASNMTAKEWYFSDCTWDANNMDIIYVQYSGQSFGHMVIKLYDSDPDNIYIKGVDYVTYSMKVGDTCTLDKILKFKPVDANFDFLEIGRTQWENPFWIAANTDEIRIEKPETLPTSWEEFYKGYKITPLKAGYKRIYFTFRSVKSAIGGGGSIELRVKNK